MSSINLLAIASTGPASPHLEFVKAYAAHRAAAEGAALETHTFPGGMRHDRVVRELASKLRGKRIGLAICDVACAKVMAELGHPESRICHIERTELTGSDMSLDAVVDISWTSVLNMAGRARNGRVLARDASTVGRVHAAFGRLAQTTSVCPCQPDERYTGGEIIFLDIAARPPAWFGYTVVVGEEILANSPFAPSNQN
jgi:hypothetical protein